ncbi:hypothetical protein EXE40_13050 [Halorubrum sp. GN11GM_10-3_MGM]|nr:hypothetical protein EXE40_13050 [Halorubrum sp. GN11GM_10-3_MGM]
MKRNIALSINIDTEVVSAVADKKNVSESELPILYESIETDALRELFEHGTTETGTNLAVQFPYAGYTVTVRYPGEITVEK